MSPLAELRAIIEHKGPLGIDEYMTLCLHHPEWGYYATRPALGAEGDFITAPLISQMFGELIGLWAAEVWMRLGGPRRVLLAEVGPGDGTLMSDMLRAARVAPRFLDAAEVWLVEPSPPLRTRQRERLGDRPRWAKSLDELADDAPLILIANEVLDCMPARQFAATGEGWTERRVGVNGSGALTFVMEAATARPPPAPTSGAAEGMLMEYSAVQAAFAGQVAERVARQGGCALLVDYGRAEFESGDTLQALRRHAKVDPLSAPGVCDLTVWAEFDVVADAARAVGAAVAGPVLQGTFLGRLGVEARAALLSRARPEHAPSLARQLHRLTHPEQMGELFKAMAVFRPGDPVPPGFEEPA